MAGTDSSSSHLNPGSHWTSESVNVQKFLRECDEWLSVHERMSQVLETNKSLSQQLSKAERKASRLEKEVEQLKKALWEKTLALDMTERELRHARRQAKERHALHLEKDQERKDAIKKAEGLQEQLAQLQSENLLLHQQLGDVQNKTTQEQMRTVGQLQGELADAFRKQWVTETSLKASTRQCDYLKQENSRLQEDLDKAKAEVRELSAQLELELEKSLQLEARNQELRGLVALLPHCLVTPGVGHTTTALHGQQCEQQAREEMSEKEYLSLHLQTQAAAQARIEEINTTDASWRKQLEQRIRALESDLERAPSTQEESALQPARAQAETKSSEKHNLVDPEMRRCLTEKLKKPNEMLAEASAKSPQEQQHRLFSRKAKSLSQSRGQSGNPSGSVTSERETGSAGDSPWTSPALPPNVNEVQDPLRGQHRSSTML
ncbi:ankyrin repeat domain-containing protein 26-like [Mycteria americana]|uniref:ankyrin repeat domain-containing protein 26-like n=1 Tax=Mycteria americana TaxID=33587 RepID=UPI003F5844E7